MKTIAKITTGMLLTVTLAAGCSYAGVATTTDNKAIVLQNNAILFGMLNKAFVCDVTPTGLANCQTNESP